MYIRMTNPTTNFMKLFDEFFDESCCITPDCCTSRKCPAHDVVENDNEFIIEMELAGVKKEDVEIDIEKDVLTIEAERKRDEKVKYNRRESYVGKYKRSFVLPDDVDTEKIKASLSEGILSITIPKAVNEAKKKKQIIVK